ncbi:21841_t:CDS:1, partial [Gigaspora margarita]
SCSYNDTSAVKDKKKDFDLAHTKDTFSKTKDHDGNHQQNLNRDTCPNSTKLVPKNKVHNNCVLIKNK